MSETQVPPTNQATGASGSAAAAGLAGFDCANALAAKTASQNNSVMRMNRLVMIVLSSKLTLWPAGAL